MAEHGWLLFGVLRPHHRQAVEMVARQGLVEPAEREMRAEVCCGQPWRGQASGRTRRSLTTWRPLIGASATVRW
ncbi:hypothetical protein ACQPXS_02430 [Streptomyces sp. CA-142005]|uniref:hypothetical protein n=1 Tax=Streptomyces sp. CA-142005 TaxID=3240052 RepID=UPI003D93382A